MLNVKVCSSVNELMSDNECIESTSKIGNEMNAKS